jgi:hypothetical protein
MTKRFWTCHWQNRFWHDDVNPEHKRIWSSAGNNFRKRGVSPGDAAYIVSLSDGQLLLGGKMTVKQILSRREMMKLRGSADIYEADEYLTGIEGSGTPLNLHRRLSPAVTKLLRFETKAGQKGPCFASDGRLDNQATRGVRELTPESAALFDRIIEMTDRLPRTGKLVTVTPKQLTGGATTAERSEFQSPEEIPSGLAHTEGNVSRVVVNRYERDPKARAACISAHGDECCICGFDFGAVYGPDAEGYIHVHHMRPLSECGGSYIVDPVGHLCPVCPNCHAVLHLGGRCRSIDEVRQLLAAQSHA